MNESYLITYRKRRGREDRLIELPSLQRLMDWIARNAAGCSMVLIQRVEGTVS